MQEMLDKMLGKSEETKQDPTRSKKGRASAAARKRRQDPNPERRGAAKNVKTKK